MSEEKLNEYQLLNRVEAYTFLGISKQEFDAAVKKGEIPFKLSSRSKRGHRRFRLGDLIEWSQKTIHHIEFTKDKIHPTYGHTYHPKLLGQGRLDALLAKQRQRKQQSGH